MCPLCELGPPSVKTDLKNSSHQAACRLGEEGRGEKEEEREGEWKKREGGGRKDGERGEEKKRGEGEKRKERERGRREKEK